MDGETLNEILAEWHRWARGYQICVGINSSPMFRESKSPRGWDTVDQIVDETIEQTRMEAVDAVIMALCDVYRTALQIQARNLVTGRYVWNSPRLPEDPAQRAKVVMEARQSLASKLRDMWGDI